MNSGNYNCKCTTRMKQGKERNEISRVGNAIKSQAKPTATWSDGQCCTYITIILTPRRYFFNFSHKLCCVVRRPLKASTWVKRRRWHWNAITSFNTFVIHHQSVRLHFLIFKILKRKRKKPKKLTYYSDVFRCWKEISADSDPLRPFYFNVLID